MTRKFMTHERTGRILAGVSVAGAVALGYFHHPLWLLAAVGTGLNLVLSGITDRCVVKNLLVRMGFPGERDLGRREVLTRMADDARREKALTDPVPAESVRRRVAGNVPLRIGRMS
ncbi:MAG: DUF2892 domain-containing protein [Planctomycetota bacterium]